MFTADIRVDRFRPWYIGRLVGADNWLCRDRCDFGLQNGKGITNDDIKNGENQEEEMNRNNQ